MINLDIGALGEQIQKPIQKEKSISDEVLDSADHDTPDKISDYTGDESEVRMTFDGSSEVFDSLASNRLLAIDKPLQIK